MTAKIFIVDDDEAVRDSLQAMLESKGYMVDVFASAEDFLTAFRPDQSGCALVDLRMPGMDGLALLDRLRTSGSALPVVMVTGHGDVPLAVQAMKAGAIDFIEKPYSNEKILELVDRALNAAPAGGFADIVPDEIRVRADSLTPRERDVLEQLVVGRPNKIIAHELKISPRTVEIHRANLMRKMEANSLSHLVRMAMAAGLVRPVP